MRLLFVATAAFAAASTFAVAEEVEGTISKYVCGDNCYLTILRSGSGEELTALCAAGVCAPWNAEAAMPTEMVGKEVVVELANGAQFDGEGTEVGTFPAFARIEFVAETGPLTAADRPILQPPSCEQLRSVDMSYEPLQTVFGLALVEWTEEDFRVVRQRLVECASQIEYYASYHPDYVGQYIDELLAHLREEANSIQAVSDHGDLQEALMVKVRVLMAIADAGELSAEDFAALDQLKKEDAALRKRFISEPTTLDPWAVTTAIEETLLRNERAKETAARQQLEEQWAREEALRPDTRARDDADALYYMYQIADRCGRAEEVWSADGVRQLQKFIVPFLVDVDEKTKTEAWAIASQRFQVVSSQLTQNDCAYVHSYFQGLGYQPNIDAGRPPF